MVHDALLPFRDDCSSYFSCFLCLFTAFSSFSFPNLICKFCEILLNESVTMFPVLYLHSIRLSLKEQEVKSMIQTSVRVHQGHYKLWWDHSIVPRMSLVVSHLFRYDKWRPFPSRLLVLHGLLDELEHWYFKIFEQLL